VRLDLLLAGLVLGKGVEIGEKTEAEADREVGTFVVIPTKELTLGRLVNAVASIVFSMLAGEVAAEVSTLFSAGVG
jgi:hypothetical protein